MYIVLVKKRPKIHQYDFEIKKCFPLQICNKILLINRFKNIPQKYTSPQFKTDQKISGLIFNHNIFLNKTFYVKQLKRDKKDTN